MGTILRQSDIILSFLYDFDLLRENCVFKAKVDFILNGRRKIGEGQVKVSFDEEDSHAVIRISNTGWNETFLPVKLESSRHTFSYIPGITLQVTGEDVNPIIGKFKVSIFPKADVLL